MNGGSSSINLKTAKGARPYRAAYAAGRCRRGDRVNRRTFISLGRGAVVAWPLAAARRSRAAPIEMETTPMAQRGPSDAPSFKELERQGWDAKADNYHSFAGQITFGAVAPLLDAAGVRAGMRVLDVASGPGYVADGATARGAHAIGVDFAANMVAEARRRYPRIEFREGDAESLAFDAASFDAVVCAFGMLHLADPDKAIAEAHRVLRPGGRYAFTVWMGPDRHDFFAIVLLRRMVTCRCRCRRPRRSSASATRRSVGRR
jgi:SAM-dependent methyltransferase